MKILVEYVEILPDNASPEDEATYPKRHVVEVFPETLRLSEFKRLLIPKLEGFLGGDLVFATAIAKLALFAASWGAAVEGVEHPECEALTMETANGDTITVRLDPVVAAEFEAE